ncbi:MAG: autotransporter outer membrane beta-barrel domain-containing protein [Alphaproteobacteria bacterium]|nr:autotransporter outer membrane beta-barrel domain-containing protein [Alphaproteobacteria bacterium]
MNMTESPGGSAHLNGGRSQGLQVRGGRMTKFHGQAASFAPGLVFGQSAASLISSVSSSALALALMIAAPLSLTVTGARATDCVVGAPGVFVCSGASVHTESLVSAVVGDLVVTATPGFSVDTTGSGGNAINLRNFAGDVNISFTDIYTSPITGQVSGISGINLGTGFLSIITTGVVTGTDNTGIIALNNNAVSTDLTINAQGAVQGGLYGVFARNDGTGAVSITTQAVTGTNNIGIYALNYNPVSTDLTINAQGAVQGETYGVDARNNGTGVLSITTQAVTGTNNVGIYALNYNAVSTNLTINAQGAVQGGTIGVDARNNGTGALSITTTGVVTGTDRDGIFADNDGTSITIDALGAVMGGEDGIDARNYGDGELSITTTGAVTGQLFEGIDAINSSAGTDLTVTVNAGSVVSGQRYGIFATNLGSGPTMITINGAVNSVDRESVQVQDSATAGAMTITVGATGSVNSDNDDGINADSYGVGDLSVTVFGSVTGGGADGIDITKYDSGTGNIIVLTGMGSSVSGTSEGIETDNEAAGGTTLITVNGTVIGGQEGIEADNDPGSGAITIITGAGSSVTGGFDGIDADNDGDGALTITVNGSVTGGTGIGINARGDGALGATTITLNAGATVSATSGQAIFNDAGDSTTTVNGGASVAGTIVLGDGSDSLAFNGGDFSGVTLFDGGDDIDVADTFIDTLTFAGSNGALIGANVINWENVVIDTGSTISFADNALTAGLLTTTGGGILDAGGGGLVLNANVLNNGTITMINGAVGDTITVNGDFSGLGSFLIDVDLASDMADTLVINGDITGGSTAVSVSDIAVGPATGNDVQIVNVTGTTIAGDFTLATPGIGAFLYDLALIGGNDWVLQQQAGFNPATAVYEAYPQILLGLNSLPTLRQRTGDQYAAYSGKGVVETGGQPTPIWTRIEGDRSVVAPATSTTALNYALRQYRIQAGLDSQVMAGAGGTLMAGVNASYGMGAADVFSATGDGSIATDLASLGATATWFGNEGFYLDGQAQMSWYTSDLSDVTSGLLAGGNQGVGYAISLEAGQSVDLGGGTSITPQAQLVYSSVGFDDFVGPGGAAVSLDAADSVLARLGLSIDKSQSWTASDGMTSSSQIYGLANLYYELAGPSQVDVSGTEFVNQPEQASAEIGLGGSFSWDDERITLFGEITAATSLENAGDSYRYKGTAGARINF